MGDTMRLTTAETRDSHYVWTLCTYLCSHFFLCFSLTLYAFRLDIPDVAHVINFDLPTRSIENYTHRIGRTGRAGKSGLATSLMTDEDEGIMAPLKQYLESTNSRVPDRLAKHPAASAGGSQHNLIY